MRGACVRKRLGYAAALAVLLASPIAQAQTAQTSVLVYEPIFFADARPNTAYDMIGRLPGFTFDDGNTARGFAGTAGNVLIDGGRPTSKTDDLQSILNRIPASDVERIELIRGGAPGIDMQGQTVVANVIRKKGSSQQLALFLDDNIWPDHHTVPSASLQYTQHSDGSTYEASLTRYGNYDDSVGKGFHNITDVATGDVTHQDARSNGRGSGGGFTGAATVPLFDGEFRANLALQASPFHSAVFYTSPGFSQVIADESGNNNGELGLHWNGKVGGVQLETLALQRLGHSTDDNTSKTVGDDEVFHSTANTGETIARATLRYLPISNLTLEGGAEGAFNYLDGSTGFIQNGVVVPLPTASAHVEERRGEVFGQGTWKIDSEWMLELGARLEYSEISESSDSNLDRKFFYPKPRAVLTWSPDKDTQVRLRYELVLGQLDFNNFIASSNLAASGVTAGNPNLMPDQHTQYELSVERHFWDKGAIVATLMHERIANVEDFVPVTGPSGVFDAPGNIGTGTNNQIDIEVTLPLDKFGLPNGLLKGTNIWRITSVRDPVTGKNRVISNQNDQYRPQDIEWTLTQDIPSLKSTWSIFYYNCWNEYFYRLEQVRHRRTVPPYMELSWVYKPSQDWSFKFAILNAGAFTYDDTVFDYTGPRDTFPLSQIEETSIHSQPRIYIQIRKTFD